jgi:hypothetical protein
MALLVSCGGPRLRSAQISQKVADADRMERWRGFFRSPVGLLVKSSTTSCWRDLHYLHEEEFRELSCQADELQRMLTALIQRFRPVEIGERNGALLSRSKLAAHS